MPQHGIGIHQSLYDLPRLLLRDLLIVKKVLLHELLDCRGIEITDMDNLDRTHNQRALEREQKEERQANQIADRREGCAFVPSADQDEE